MNDVLFSLIRSLFQNVGSCWPALFARWGMRLWGKTYRSPWRPWETAIIQTAIREFLPVEDEQIAVYHWGKGAQKILILPGWNSRASHFKNYIESLTHGDYHVVGIDPVGHGHSSGRWTNLRQYLSVIHKVSESHGPFHAVIGHSFGGFCIPLALSTNQFASKAVLLAAPNNLEWLFQRIICVLRAPPAVGKHMREITEKMMGRECWDNYSISRQAPNLQEISTLIVHDEDDTGVPLTLAKDNHAAWPGSRLLVTHDLGHQRVLRHPSAVEPVIEFIQED